MRGGKRAMHIHGRKVRIFLSSILPLFLFGCGTDRVSVEFKTSKQIYVDDSKTDPEELNRELEYDLREAEKKRLRKQREAEAAAKAKAEEERKTKADQRGQERVTDEEALQLPEAEQPLPQQ